MPGQDRTGTLLAMLILPASLLSAQHGLITRRQLREAALDDRQIRVLVRRKVLLEVRRSVYVERERWEELDPYRGQPLLRIRASRLTLGGDYAHSHDSSAPVQELGSPTRGPHWCTSAARRSTAMPAGRG